MWLSPRKVKNNPKGVTDFGANDDTAVEYASG
jgi:hypothetical protein